MTEDPIAVVRSAFDAFLSGDLEALRAHVDPDLAWTYLDPAFEDPEPETCHGRVQLEEGVRKWLAMGLSTEIEELVGWGDKVVVVMRTPGLDKIRARAADDRNFHVVTVRDGRVTALRACKDRSEARRLANLDSGPQ